MKTIEIISQAKPRPKPHAKGSKHWKTLYVHDERSVLAFIKIIKEENEEPDRCFHKEFKKDKKHNFFQWENTEHLTKNQLKLQEKQNKSLPPCIYCKRKFGHKKLCTSCNKEYMHSICAYKNNSLLSFLECTSDNERKLKIKELLCTN